MGKRNSNGETIRCIKIRCFEVNAKGFLTSLIPAPLSTTELDRGKKGEKGEKEPTIQKNLIGKIIFRREVQ
jgi:hypothetical protein